ncbi:uncharacterized protein LOC133038192 [Cannabis sativa]|uniref:uncharacterized protein LOC133038192 n=1 Tax=Cannabis sativa TaxID=3483 RepID=UPI0029CA5A0A|nr:uncharacterized protein LOC133038192 [Cannabis sativa]
MAMLNQLKTKDMIAKYQLEIDKIYLLCSNEEESMEHLFFNCYFGQACLNQVQVWLNWNMCKKSLPGVIKWLGNVKISKCRRGVMAAALAALVYTLWCSRNSILWENKVVKSDVITTQVKNITKCQISCIWPKKVTNREIEYGLKPCRH